MKKVLLALSFLLVPACAMAAGLEDCSPLASGYIRDGSGPTCANLLKVNPDGSINTNATTANTEASPGSDATKAMAVQGITGGKAINSSPDGVVDGAIRSDTSSAIGVPATITALSGGGIDTTGYGAMSFEIITNASGNSITVEGSNDGGTTWGLITIRGAGSLASSPASTTGNSTAAGAVYVPVVVMPKMRWRVSAYVSGSTTIATSLKRSSSPTTMDVNVGNTVGIPINERPFTTGGMGVTRIVTGASGVNKASVGQVYGYHLLNTTAAIRYFQFYNKTTAGVPGTDTPIWVVPIPAGASAVVSMPSGVAHSTGISWAITTDAAGATIGTSGDVVGTVTYF